MKVKARQRLTDDSVLRGVPFLPGDVTHANYVEKALSFMRVSGWSDGDHPVVSLDDADYGPFLAWAAYLSRLKPTPFTRRASALFSRSQRRLTVPSVWPWEFSLDADDLRDDLPAMLNAERERRRAEMAAQEIGPQQRARLSAMARGMLPEMRSTSPRRRPNWRERPDPAPTLRAWKPGDEAPPQLSDAAIATTGRQRPQRTEDAA